MKTNRRAASDTMPHPFALLFPAVTGDALKALVTSIRERGFLPQFPIYTYQGKVLEGWTRHRASKEAGVEPIYKEFDGDDASALAFVCAANVVRRHLTSDQKREVVTGVLKQNPKLSDRQIASMVGVSPTTVGSVRATVQIGQSDKRVGKDGKERPAKQPRKARKRFDPDNEEDRERWVNGLSDAGEAALKAGKHIWQFADIDSDGQPLMWWAILTPPPDDPENYPFLFDGMGVDDDGKFFNKCGPYDTAEEAEAAYAEWPEFLAAEEAAQGQPDPEPQPERDSIADMMAAAAAAAAQPDPTDRRAEHTVGANGQGNGYIPDPNDDVDPLDAALDGPEYPDGPASDPTIQRALTKCHLDNDIVELVKAAVSPPSEREVKRRRRLDLSEKVILTPGEVQVMLTAIAVRVATFAAENPNYGMSTTAKKEGCDRRARAGRS